MRWLPTGLLIPVTVLLPLSRGLSLTEIGLIFRVQGLVVLALELPTGGLSDSLGRRPVLILASFVGLALARARLSSPTRWRCSPRRWSLQGVFRALDSGPLEAWYVDATLAAEPDAEIETGLGAGSTVLSLAIAVGALLSGGLVALDPFDAIETLALPLLVALGLGVVNLVAIVALMSEVRRARGAARGRELGPRPCRRSSRRASACSARRASCSRSSPSSCSGASRWSPSRASSRSACRRSSATLNQAAALWAR